MSALKGPWCHVNSVPPVDVYFVRTYLPPREQ
jgi:hypothetical protein